jgi:hypothetical protein
VEGGLGAAAAERKKRASGAHGRTACTLVFPEPAFPQHSRRGADLMDAVPLRSIASIVP